MWEDLCWFFEPGAANGFNDGSIADYKSTKYDGLAREIIQNSLDAKNNEIEDPVKVVFEKLEFDINLFPDIDGYIDTVEKCIDFIKDDTGNRSIQDLEQILRYLKHCKTNERFNVLKISDYNTKGLDGSNKSYGSSWANLVRISGNSNKGAGSQGSFGIGKYAPFVFSNIRSIIYSTKDMEGNVAVQGKAILSGHKSNGITKTPNGYFGNYNENGYNGISNDNCQAILDPLCIPEEYIRKETGTSIYILCSSTPSDWIEQVISSVIVSFFYAINNEKLIVEVVDKANRIILDKNSLGNSIDACLETDSNNRELKTTHDVLKIFNNSDKCQEFNKTFTLPNNKNGSMNLKLYTEKGMESCTIIHVRKAGMKIEEKKLKSLMGFVGIAITTNDDMNEFLTRCEAPKHDKWDAKNNGDEEQQQQAKVILNEMKKWEVECVKNLIPKDETERLDPLGMEEFLAMDTDGIGEESKSNVEVVNFKPLETVIKKKKESKQTYVSIDSNDFIVPDPFGEEELEGANGSNRGHGGTGEGNGRNGGSGRREESKLHEKNKIKIKYIKTPYMNEKGKYIISFLPLEDKDNCELRVRQAGDDMLENVKIDKLYMLTDSGKKEVSTFCLSANERITFEAHFENIDRVALEVCCYVKK